MRTPDLATETVSPALVVDGLRRWARGAYAEEAAVELLARASGGRFVSAGCRWVRACDRPGWFWLDGEALMYDTGALSGGERRLLAAFAHAAGSHEHSAFIVQGDRAVFRRLRPLVDWPSLGVEVAS